MREKLNRLLEHPAVQLLRKYFGDPVQLYTVFLMMTVMYYYHETWCWLYTLLTAVLSYPVMKFYDFVARHKYLGPPCYIGYLFAGLFVFRYLVEFGYADYPVFYLVWFLTPQGVIDFSLWYTLATFWLMLGFLSSTVYYFAKVRYRMVMQFLIMMIPLSLYGKEGLQMPAILVILLLCAYFLLMVYCRQLRGDGSVRILQNRPTGMAVALYVLAFSILGAIVPKPKVEADRTYIEQMLAYSTLSDVLMEAISGFTQSTDNTFFSTNSSRVLYTVDASESLRLRTQTYTYYKADDSWNGTEQYDFHITDYAEELTVPGDVLSCLLLAARSDADFAAAYGLTEFCEIPLPAQRREIMTFYPRFSGRLVPSPTRIGGFPSWMEDVHIQKTYHDILTGSRGQNGFGIFYYPDTYARNARVNALLCALDGDRCEQMLRDAAEVIAYDAASALMLTLEADECAEAYAFLGEVQGMDFQSEAITALAREITAGCDSDYEKAHAIECYFTEAGFVYDEDYRKGADDNIEDFLLTSKRGVCYEYATAMVLLCRAAGLPARYVQGYSMSELAENEEGETYYRIRVRDAHAFPEVYIAGYGWLSFEPTVAAQAEGGLQLAENRYVTAWGFGILGAALLAGGMALLLPMLREALFRRRMKKCSTAQAAAAIFARMRTRAGCGESVTVMELLDRSSAFCEDAVLFLQLDAVLYGGSETPEANELLGGYITWCDARTAYLNEEKRKAREARRLARKQRRNIK